MARTVSCLCFIFVLCATVGCRLDDVMSRDITSAKAMDTVGTAPASIETCVRVDQVGQNLLTHNPFLGVTPTFGVIGKSEKAIFHPDKHGILITEGLVNDCQTDDELAAVLALELADMVAEHRHGTDKGMPTPLPAQPNGGANTLGQMDDMQRMTESLVRDNAIKNGASEKPKEPQKIAGELLQNAGIESDVLVEARKKRADSKRSSFFETQIGTKSPAPTWTPTTER